MSYLLIVDDDEDFAAAVATVLRGNGHDVRIDQVILREFLARAVASLGLFHAPLKSKDFLTIQREALYYPLRWAAGF